ncbi:MAG: hypothetical protein U0936_24795 [Planctomycetaceae bacterium]
MWRKSGSGDEKEESIQAVIERWLTPESKGSGIVYFTLIRTLLEFSERLQAAAGVDHVCYHGDLDRQSGGIFRTIL